MGRERAILHFNVADFAVAVERVADCALRKKPVIVAPFQAARAVVYDMSEEAFQEKIRGCLAIGGLEGRETLIAQAVAELRDARSVAELMRRCDPGYNPH